MQLNGHNDLLDFVDDQKLVMIKVGKQTMESRRKKQSSKPKYNKNRKSNVRQMKNNSYHKQSTMTSEYGTQGNCDKAHDHKCITHLLGPMDLSHPRPGWMVSHFINGMNR